MKLVLVSSYLCLLSLLVVLISTVISVAPGHEYLIVRMLVAGASGFCLFLAAAISFATVLKDSPIQRSERFALAYCGFAAVASVVVLMMVG